MRPGGLRAGWGRVSVSTAVVVGLALAVALSLAVAGTLTGSGHDTAETASAPGSGCADLLVYAVPGNAQGTGSHPTGFGKVTGNFVREYEHRATRAGRSVEARVLDFRTARVTTLRPARHRHDAASKHLTRKMVRHWRHGTNRAAGQLADRLRTARAHCPNQGLILVGYAQGAGAVHRAVLALTEDRNMLRRVEAVVLISDPTRSPHAKAWLRGKPRAPRSATGVGTARHARIPHAATGRLRGHVASICRRGDIVCDLGPLSVNRAVYRAHAYNRGRNAAEVRAVAGWAWRSTLRVPKVPSVTRIHGRVGAQVDTRLPAEVRHRFAGALRWRAWDPTPPGITLTKRGRLVGVPTVPGSWTVRYVVRNTGEPGYHHPVRGSVEITVDPGARSLDAGGLDTCQVTDDHELYCWGANQFGQLGNRSRTGSNVPVRVPGKIWTKVSTGGAHTCGIKTTGRLFCWGLNNFGQVGDGTTRDRQRPIRLSKQAWRDVSAGWHATCGIKATGSLYCWGLNRNGTLGTGDTRNQHRPVRVGNHSDWVSVSTNGDHTCGTRSDGTAWCWGANEFGQLGDGSRTTRLVPTRVGTATTWARISTGWLHTCGFTATGWGLCWGFNGNGQLGDGTHTTRLVPTNLATPRTWVDLTAGEGFSCGRKEDGSAWCWGNGVAGQLGSGGSDSNVPRQVSGGAVWDGVAAGFTHGCGLLASGGTSCWGTDDAGQLGDGRSVSSSTPTPVQLP